MQTNFRSILLIIVCLFVSTAAFAQKCKYDYQVKDEFTGKEVKSIHTSLIGSFLYSWVKWTTFKDKDDFKIAIGLLFNGEQNEFMKTTDSLFIKLNNGKIHTFVPIQATAPQSQVGKSGVYTMYQPVYMASREFYTELASNELIAIKIFVSGTEHFFGVDKFEKKAPKKISEAAACIIN